MMEGLGRYGGIREVKSPLHDYKDVTQKAKKRFISQFRKVGGTHSQRDIGMLLRPSHGLFFAHGLVQQEYCLL